LGNLIGFGWVARNLEAVKGTFTGRYAALDGLKISAPTHATEGGSESRLKT